MSNDQNLPVNYADRAELRIPEFSSRPELVLDISSIVSGEQRIIEAKVVNPATYNELEFLFNEGYRQARTNNSIVGYEITRAKKILRDFKSVLILDEYPDFLKEKKLKDNATVRDAFLQKDKNYSAAQDRIDMLVAIESLMEGKLKIFENVCRYMKKEIDIVLRSGIDINKYSK